MQEDPNFHLCDLSEEYIANKKLATDAFHRFLLEPENVDTFLQRESAKSKDLFDGYADSTSGFCTLEIFQTIIPSMFLAMMYGLDLPYDDPVLKQMTAVVV